MTPTIRPPLALAALFLALALAGCNTVRGAGEDIESGGEGISDSAEEVQDEIGY
jgi:predicted small secreted protein